MNATTTPERWTNSKKMVLSCTAQFSKINSSEEYVGDENLWKLCVWTHLSNKAACSILASNIHSSAIDKCDSSFTKRPEGVDIGSSDRRVCELIIHQASSVDLGEWTCRLEKCKNLKNGGCADKHSSKCFGVQTITVRKSTLKR